MSWFKLDDGFFDNPKIAELSPLAQLAYVKAGVYVARNLLDGKLPARKAQEFAGKYLKELVPHLWEPIETGYMIHDYLEYNPTKEKVLEEREKARRRMFRLRSGELRANNGRTISEVLEKYG